MKQYHRYRMDFSGKSLGYSCIFMGLSLFLLVFYYLGMNRLERLPMVSKVFNLWFPVALCVVYIFLLRILRLNAPGMFAILGVVLCLLLILNLFLTASILRAILGIVVYTFSACMLILCAGGYLPGRLPATVCFGIVLLVRLLVFDLGKLSGEAWIPECAILCMIAGIALLPLGMIDGNQQTVS